MNMNVRFRLYLTPKPFGLGILVIFALWTLACQEREQGSIVADDIELGSASWTPDWVKPVDIQGLSSDWIEVSSPLENELGKHCVSRGTSGTWHVSAEDGISVTRWEPSSRQGAAPFDFQEILPIEPIGLPPRFEWTSVDDGFIVGMERGESEGGLWWVSRDGKSLYALTQTACQVRAIRRLGGRNVVFCEGAHRVTSEISEIVLDQEATWSLRALANLDGSIMAVEPGSSHSASLLLILDNAIYEFGSEGLELRAPFDSRDLSPTSVARRSGSTLLLAGRHALVSLEYSSPNQIGKRRWFVPRFCVQVKAVEGTANCRCVPLESLPAGVSRLRSNPVIPT